MEEKFTFRALSLFDLLFEDKKFAKSLTHEIACANLSGAIVRYGLGNIVMWKPLLFTVT